VGRRGLPNGSIHCTQLAFFCKSTPVTSHTCYQRAPIARQPPSLDLAANSITLSLCHHP